MKKTLLSLSVIACLSTGLYAQLPQLPNTGGATAYNVQTLPAGSYIIAMDNENQSNGTAVSVSQAINISNGSSTATMTAVNGNVYAGMTMTATGVPAGTRVVSISGTTITMSNAATATATNRACTFGTFEFNLKAYGLLVDLLNNNKRLKWVIRPNKTKDAIDFNASTQLMTTTATVTTTTLSRNITIASGSFTGTLNSGTGVVTGMVVSGQAAIPANTLINAVSGTSVTLTNAATAALSNKAITLTTYSLASSVVTFGAASSRDFRSGAFVISQPDTAGVAALVAFYNQRVSSAAHVKVYRTTADVDVDVRFDYLINGTIWKPKVAILDDGGNGTIHEDYMPIAGISFSNGFANYTVETTPAFTTKCYTLATEPHNGNTDTTVAGVGTAGVISSIKQFVQNGGNFLAQCHAIWTYENYSGGRFMTNHGIWRGLNSGSNATVTNEVYHNSDLPYGQINGAFSCENGGSVQNWKLNPVAGNAWINNEHPFVTGSAADGQADIRGASAAKLTPANQLGGMVFYVGSHKFDDADEFNRNGLRFYMDAVMTPTNPQGSLQTGVLVQCLNTLSDPTVFTVTSPSGPVNAYPLTFNVYADIAAPFASTDITGDVFLGTATITAAGQTPTITIPATGPLAPYRKNTNYVAVITPNSGCLQPLAKVPNSCASTLPVVLKTFTAARSQSNQENVQVRWVTSTEQNSAGYEVEVFKGGSWQLAGYVPSQSADGNSASELTYSFTDRNTERAMSQYRLRMIDKDSRFKYSDVRSVRGLDQKSSMIVYPNPSNDGKVNVVFDETNVIRDLSVQDMSGRIIKQMNGISTNNIQIDNLVSGMYSIRVINRNTGEMTVQKVVVNKR